MNSSLTKDNLALYGGKPIRKDCLLLNKPFIGEEEIKAASDSIRSGHIIGNGPKGKELEREIRDKFKIKQALLVNSCTSAMEIALRVSEIKLGDEVICPSFAFASISNAIVLQGAKPVFVDIDKNTYNIDPAKIKKAITCKTKAIMPVHYAGQACQMDEINKIALDHGLTVIEDAAQGIGAKYKGKYLGTLENIGCFSFHGTKNLVCGEGGVLLTNNDELFRKAEIIREKGTNRNAFFRGEVDKYEWLEIGSSYVLSDILAAIALEQFKKLKIITEKRQKNAELLTEKLRNLEDRIVLPFIADDVKTNWHLYTIRVPKEKRNWMIKSLIAEGIGCSFHFTPLHSSPYARRNLGYRTEDLPITEEISATLIKLPMYPQLTEKDIDDIAAAIRKIVNSDLW